VNINRRFLSAKSKRESQAVFLLYEKASSVSIRISSYGQEIKADSVFSGTAGKSIIRTENISEPESELQTRFLEH
jgi:hypothetical protein